MVKKVFVLVSSLVVFFGASTACGNTESLSYADEQNLPVSTNPTNIYEDPFGSATISPNVDIEGTTPVMEDQVGKPIEITTTTIGEQSPRAIWLQANTGFFPELEALRGILARDINDISDISAMCFDVDVWSREADRKYQPPLPSWDQSIVELQLYSAQCLAGDLPVAVRMAGSFAILYNEAISLFVTEVEQ